jgi:predicted DNA-binding protein YlxM (UPF0122 family)
MKGRHFGRLGTGVKYQIGESRWNPPGCECKERWCDIGYTSKPDPSRRVSACMDKETGATTLGVEKDAITRASQKKRDTDPLPLTERKRHLHLVLPCGETFRHPHSTGTKLHGAISDGKSQFRGCQKLEDELLAEDLIKHSQNEVIGTLQDFGLAQEQRENEREDETSEEVKTRENNWEIKEPNRSGLDQEGAAVSDGPLSSSWMHMSEVTTILPKASHERWVEYLRDYPDEFDLTYKQKSAVTLFLLENDDARKIAEVAEKLRITVDSLKDRINQVKKKVLKLFPHAAEDSKTKVTRKEKLDSDFAFGGFYRKSSARHKAPLYSVNPSDLRKKVEVEFPPKTAKRTRGDLSKEERDRLTERYKRENLVLYIPNHDGIFCSWLPIGPRKKTKTEILLDQTDYRRRLPNLRDWEKK